MKTIYKILAPDAPPALCAALREQWGDAGSIDTTPVDGGVYDLVLQTAETPRHTAAGFAVPVLRQSLGSPFRLGRLIRQMRQIMADPALYLEDIPLGRCLFQPQEKNIRHGSEDMALTDKEVEILAYLIRRQAATVTRDDLLKNVWRYQTGVDTHTLETHVYRLRQKLSSIPDLKNALITDDDGGYRFICPD